MPNRLRIAGQGIAGSLLSWELLKAGIDFEVWDRGHALASSRVGAGMINPITGQRFVKSWRVEELLPLAKAVYSEIEDNLEVSLLSSQRIHRLLRDEREKRIYEEKRGTGELAPFLGEASERGFWIEGAVRVDSARLLATLRTHLKQVGRLKEKSATPEDGWDGITIWCTGVHHQALLQSHLLTPAFGEILTILAPELPVGTILNRGHWILPIDGVHAKVGATFVVKESLYADTPSKSEELLESAEAILGRTVEVVGRDTGWRLTTPDKHPVCGWYDAAKRQGVINGLGSKGALLAPALAKNWLAHLREGTPFDPAWDLGRLKAATA